MEANLGQVTLVRDINLGGENDNFNSSNIDNLIVLKNKVYFAANDGLRGKELWVSDGTTGGTQIVADIRLGRNSEGTPRSSSPYDLIEIGDQLYFTANNGINGRELWTSNGTEKGTQLVADIYPGREGSLSGYYGYEYFYSPIDFVELNGKLYFSADDGTNGTELWVTDGTTDGTQLLKDINPGTSESDYGSFPYSSYAENFTELNGKLYFSADDGENGRELWVTDGTTDGTQLLKDINPGTSEGYYGSFPSSSSPDSFTELNGKLYFSADDGENGRELWVTDGTTDGTQLLKDINPGTSEGYGGVSYPNSSNPYTFAEFNDLIYFTADNGVNGKELWVTDGTTDGTQLLKDINPGTSEGYGGESYPNSSYVENFTEFNNKLYFTADDGVNGRELWVSDGTTDGTQLVKDINPGTSESYGGVPYPSSSSPNSFTEFNDLLYFAADDGVNGIELWVTDGTTDGTQLVADINPGSDSSYVDNLVVVGNQLLFTADNGTSGKELFKLSFDNSTTLTGTNRADSLNGTNRADKIEGLNGNDTLSGLAGNDTLLGDGGSDTLNGGNGNDVLDGGAGVNTLTGGGGNDVFTIREGNGRDNIADFRLGKDLIGLAGGLQFDDLTFSGDTIKSGGDLLATVSGVETVGLRETDFTVI